MRNKYIGLRGVRLEKRNRAPGGEVEMGDLDGVIEEKIQPYMAFFNHYFLSFNAVAKPAGGIISPKEVKEKFFAIEKNPFTRNQFKSEQFSQMTFPSLALDQEAQIKPDSISRVINFVLGIGDKSASRSIAVTTLEERRVRRPASRSVANSTNEAKSDQEHRIEIAQLADQRRRARVHVQVQRVTARQRNYENFSQNHPNVYGFFAAMLPHNLLPFAIRNSVVSAGIGVISVLVASGGYHYPVWQPWDGLGAYKPLDFVNNDKDPRPSDELFPYFLYAFVLTFLVYSFATEICSRRFMPPCPQVNCCTEGDEESQNPAAAENQQRL